MSKKQIKFLHKTAPHVRKRDGETVEYALKISLSLEEAAIVENMFINSPPEAPRMSLFRAFVLNMAHGMVNEKLLAEKIAWVKTIKTLSDKLSEQDCTRALSFIKNPPIVKSKPVIPPAQPTKTRRVFIP